eukprot:SAG11_NODE_9082_length_946_cov_1.234947_1_plen_232_part_00
MLAERASQLSVGRSAPELAGAEASVLTVGSALSAPPPEVRDAQEHLAYERELLLENARGAPVRDSDAPCGLAATRTPPVGLPMALLCQKLTGRVRVLADAGERLEALEALRATEAALEAQLEAERRENAKRRAERAALLEEGEARRAARQAECAALKARRQEQRAALEATLAAQRAEWQEHCAAERAVRPLPSSRAFGSPFRSSGFARGGSRSVRRLRGERRSAAARRTRR